VPSLLEIDDPHVAYAVKSSSEIRLAYRLYQIVSHPQWLRLIIPFLRWAAQMPLFHSLIRKTLYRLFIGGETIDEVLQLAQRLRRYGVYSIPDYAVERAESESTQQKVLTEVKENIDRAATHPEVPLVVFKLTGITGIELPEKISLGIASASEQKRWSYYTDQIGEVFCYAQQHNITICVDAEETWIQPAIDALIHQYTWEFNKDFPTVMHTVQLYRRDGLEYFQWYLEECRRRGVIGGMKLVRGAYLEKERERARRQGYPSPLHPSKAATDRAYNRAVLMAVQHADTLKSVIATHNIDSCHLAVDEMQRLNLPVNHPNIWFSQLYGIRDNLTFALAKAGANATKYIPYGPVREVIPYLLRRMTENADAMNYASEELRLLRKAMQQQA